MPPPSVLQGGSRTRVLPYVGAIFGLALPHHFQYARSITTSVVRAMDKAYENRLRRMAARQGYWLTKSRSRDPRACDFGLYALKNLQTGGAVNPALADRWMCSWTLENVEQWLTRE